MSLKGILGGIDVDVIPEQCSTDQSPPGLLGTYKRLDGIKGCEYRTSSWHRVNSIYCTNLNRHVETQGTDRGNIFVHKFADDGANRSSRTNLQTGTILHLPRGRRDRNPGYVR